MFNAEYVRKVMNVYNCNQIAVNDKGECFAMAPERQVLIPDFVFDTDSMDIAIETTDKIVKG
jgi:hypothetical protein